MIDLKFTLLTQFFADQCLGTRDCPPTEEAISACSERLAAELADVKSPVVLSTGNTPTQALLGKGTPKITQARGRGKWVRDKFIIPSFHPSYILRDKEQYPFLLDTYKQGLWFANNLSLLPAKLESGGRIPYTYCVSPRQVAEGLFQLEFLLEQSPDKRFRFALDTETEYAGEPTYTILTIQISDGGQNTLVFEADAILSHHKKRFADLLGHPRIDWIMHNVSFDLHYLKRNFGVLDMTVDDTMCLQLCVSEHANECGLKYLAPRWLGADKYEEELKQYTTGRKKVKKWSDIPREVLVPYGALDAYYTWHLYNVLIRQVEQEGNYSLYEEILLPAQKMFADTEQHGILMDVKYLQGLSEEYRPIITEYEAKIIEFARKKGFKASDVPAKGKPKSEDIKPKSVNHKRHLFYTLLEKKKVWEKGKSQKGGDAPNTGKVFYDAYPTSEETKLFKGYSRVSKMVSTYVTGTLDDIHPDNRVRPSFKIYGAVTGRLSAGNPPVQTIPSDAKLNDEKYDIHFPSIRKAVIARPGYVIVEADYKALELYIAYHYSHDGNLIAALQSGDFHTLAASNVYLVPLDQVTDLQRKNSKTITYGVMYRLQAHSLQRDIGGSFSDCQLYIDNWFDGFPGYREWWQEQQDTVMRTGRLRTATGRIRRWDYICKDNEDRIKNQAVNFPIQSLANDLCLYSMIELNQVLRKADLGATIMTVHDSIEFELRIDSLHESLPLIEKVMTTPQFDTIVERFPIDIQIGPNWSELVEKDAYKYERLPIESLDSSLVCAGHS